MPKKNTTLILKIGLILSLEVALERSCFQLHVLYMCFMDLIAEIWTFLGTL